MTPVKDLSVVDSIIVNLVSVRNLYQFEYEQLGTFLSLMNQFEEAKLKSRELLKKNDIFIREFNGDVKFYRERMKWLQARISKLSKDIENRKQAKQKLMQLFDSLQSLDTLNDSNPNQEESNLEAGLPIMNIREELDENGNVMKSSVKPYEKSKLGIFEKNANTTKKASSISSNLHPYGVTEESDEDGNIVRSSVRKLPVSEKKKNETTDDQISLLMKDMDLIPKEEPRIVELEDGIDSTKDSSLKVQQKIDSSMYAPEIDPEDLLTLEVIANEVNNDDDDNDDDDNDDDCDMNNETGITSLVPPESRDLLYKRIQELRIAHRDTRDDQTAVRNDDSEFSKTSEKKKPSKSVSFAEDVDVKEVEDIWDDLRESEQQGGHPKVSEFKLMMEGAAALEKEEVEKPKNHETIANGLIVGDVMEHDTEARGSNIGFQETKKSSFDEPVAEETSENLVNMDRLKPEKGMMRLGGKKPIFRSRLNKVVEMGKQYQKRGASIEKQKSSSPFKKDFKSLRPAKKVITKSLNSEVIESPKDDNSLVKNLPLEVEDFDIVREHITEEDGEDENSQMIEDYKIVESKMSSGKELPNLEEFKDSEKVIKLTSKQLSELQKHMKNATLDYKSVGNDTDTMARAYVMGLYDDDIEEDDGVIEEVDDFKKHNKEVEKNEQDEKDGKDEKDGRDEKDENEGDVEDGPIMEDNIIEHDTGALQNISDDDIDIELNSESLNSEIALDYTRAHERMLEKYNGGFKKTDLEKEFEPLDDAPKVSRFKAARLGRKA
ncbi:hypothetical protein FOA43_002297 [Brettanomyces nanus]|uniref:DUF3835 domain-containing protein n=1 Tax=Eeniella nana TaxID=13502 RepID=A0A875S1Y2_EENNA|nr:uncharacterized protein FOA43_002297 [Brettanomyces nanus]QPG74958.1 hypothetical protein FOA43_002297 [Brettanomyces nanus]